MRHLAYSFRYSVVPIKYSLSAVTLYRTVRTTLLYNDTMYSARSWRYKRVRLYLVALWLCCWFFSYCVSTLVLSALFQSQTEIWSMCKVTSVNTSPVHMFIYSRVRSFKTQLIYCLITSGMTCFDLQSHHQVNLGSRLTWWWLCESKHVVTLVIRQ